VYRPIGVIWSPFKEPRGTPIQPCAAEGIRGTVEVFPQFAPALKDIEGFSHIILLYHFNKAKPFRPLVVPYLHDKERGLFATRSPARPNPIGLSVVRLLQVEGNILHVECVDVVDGTPLLDIKPFVPQFNAPGQIRIGWLKERIERASKKHDDGRFAK